MQGNQRANLDEQVQLQRENSHDICELAQEVHFKRKLRHTYCQLPLTHFSGLAFAFFVEGMLIPGWDLLVGDTGLQGYP